MFFSILIMIVPPRALRGGKDRKDDFFLKIITDRDLPLSGRTVLTIGAFDGVHIGHACLLRSMCAVSGEKRLPNAVWTFAESPKALQQGAKYITGSVEKMEALEKLGAEQIYFADFERCRSMTPSEFVEKALIGDFHADTVVCGFDFRFGASRAGDAQTLKALLAQAGVSCIVVPPVKAGDETVSSTLIRRKLAEGDIEGASFLLGRRYSFLLPVIHGRRLGRTIGFPTINQRFPAYQVVPAYGVYACLCEVDGKLYRGVSNIGVRPTVSEHEDAPLCETHIFDFSDDLYDKEARVYLCRRIRPERRFDSVEALREQVERDKQAARAYFANFL